MSASPTPSSPGFPTPEPASALNLTDTVPGLGGRADSGLDPELAAAAEAILIVSDEPVTPAALGRALHLEPDEAERLLRALAAEYAGQPATQGENPDLASSGVGNLRPRGFVLREAAGGWRFASAPRFSELVEDYVVGGATARLSQAALETLAVIAYRQPITRGRVAAVRGVNVDGVVRTLHARGLIEEAGTEPSGAVLYRTTSEFLEYVGLASLEDLPPLAPYLPDSAQLGEIDSEAGERAQRVAARTSQKDTHD